MFLLHRKCYLWGVFKVVNSINPSVLDMLGYCNQEGISQLFSQNWENRNQIDVNRDTMITGEELCDYSNKTCLSTQSVSFNVVVGSRNLVEVAQTPVGCFGGRMNNEEYANNSQEGMIAWCCSP